jgi:hypothetical protein
MYAMKFVHWRCIGGRSSSGSQFGDSMSHGPVPVLMAGSFVGIGSVHESVEIPDSSKLHKKWKITGDNELQVLELKRRQSNHRFEHFMIHFITLN